MSQIDRTDGLVGSAAIKYPCVAGSTGNLTLSGEQTIDGIACVTGDRVLVKDQTTGSQNGIYVVDTGSWERAQDADNDRAFTEGSLVLVTEGTVSYGFWYVSNTSDITIDTTTITFTRASNVLALYSAFIQTLLVTTNAAAARAVLQAAGTGDSPSFAALTLTGTDLIVGGFQVPYTGGLAKNLLDNPDGMIAQRTLGSGLADDTYDFDRWYALTQTGTVTSSQQTDVGNGTPYMMRLTQSQAVAQRMGRAQIIEGKNCKKYRGKAVTLTVKAKCSASQAIRYAILEWTGTEDAVTSDVVNSWTNPTYTAGQFFNATTLTVSGVGADTPAAATLETLDSLTVTLGSTFNNLIVFAWTEGTAAQNVTLDLALQLEPGSESTEFERRDAQGELARCQRHYEVGADRSAIMWAGLTDASVGGYYSNKAFRVVKRAIPTVTTSAETISGFASGTPTLTMDVTGLQAVRVSNGVLTAGAYYFYNWAATADL